MSRGRSRIRLRLEKETRKNFAISVAGSVLILFLLVKFGIPLLANFALFISGFKNDSIVTSKNSEFISAPVLDPLPQATNSAKLKIKGKASENLTINLYLNGSITDKDTSDKDGNFSFEINLIKGENKIFAKSKKDNLSSEASEEFAVLYNNTPPSVSIDSPSDGQQFSGDQNSVTVTGTTDVNVKVTVNGFWSIVDQNNKFSYQLPLKEGDNEIKVIAEDSAGNTMEKKITIKYSR